MVDKEKLLKTIDSAAFVLLLISALAIPLYFDTHSYNYFVLPKTFAISLVAVFSVLLTLKSFYIRKQIIFIRSTVDWLIVGLLGLTFVSSIFGLARTDSLTGRMDYFVLNGFLLSMLALYFWQIVQTAESEQRVRTLQNTLLLAGGVTGLMFFFKSVLQTGILSSFLKNVWNTVDITNTNFAVWLAVILVLAFGRLLNKRTSIISVVLLSTLSASVFYCLLLLGIKSAWALVATGMTAVALLGYVSLKSSRRVFVVASMFLAIISIVFSISGSPKISSVKFPLEVTLGASPAREIALHSVTSGVKELLLGSGPGTFRFVFSKFRDASFNYDQTASGLRFNYPNNSLKALLVEQGILFVLTLAALVIVLAWRSLSILRIIKKMEIEYEEDGKEADLIFEDYKFDPFVSAIALLVLTVGMFTTFYSITLWWLWWFLLGLTVVGISLLDRNEIKIFSFRFDGSNERASAFVFGIFVVAASLGIVLFSIGRSYYADRLFAKVFTVSNNVNSEELLKRSMKLRNNEIVHVALAQIYLDRAIASSQEAKPDLNQVSDNLGSAVSEAKIATDLSPKSVSLWENLAKMYENAAQLVPEARNLAIAALVEAKKLEPSNYLLAWRLGSNYEQNKNYSDAARFYQEALSLRTDFSEARMSLANVYELNKQSDKALGILEAYLRESPEDVATLYNYGRLLYNRNQKGDRDTAERVWLLVLKKEPNHSNTLYSLGLLYEQKGSTSKALEYFYRVRELNPLRADNANLDAVNAVTDKIRKLGGN